MRVPRFLVIDLTTMRVHGGDEPPIFAREDPPAYDGVVADAFVEPSWVSMGNTTRAEFAYAGVTTIKLDVRLG